MRLRLPILIVLPVSLLLAAPAAADDQSVNVIDFEFEPRSLTQIQPGDTVTWTFENGGHTTTSNRDQPESWNSRLKSRDTSFSHTFEHPGKYQYLCLPHRDFMKGTIVVGQDEVAKTFQSVRTRRTARGARVTFELNEPAVVSYGVRGPSRKRVSTARLENGTHVVKVGRLKAGRYRGTLTFQDDFDNKSTARNSFRIR
jgi:plastocyanin